MTKAHRSKRELCIRRMREIHELSMLAVEDVTQRPNFLVRYSIVGKLVEDFETAHLKIIQVASDAEFTAEDAIRLEFDQMRFAVIGRYERFVGIDRANASSAQTPTQKASVRLPKISLPQFSGDLALWPPFFALYNASIHENQSISSVEKFQYLLASLTGEALNVVKNLPLSADNYAIAYDSLVKRYQSKRVLADHHVNLILNANPLKSESAASLRVLLDTFTENTRALNLLGFPTDSWDYLLLKFLSDKLPRSLREKFESEHRAAEIPKYTQLVTFLAEYCQVLAAISGPSSLSLKTPVPKKSVSLATRTAECPVCKEQHLVFKCSRFLKLSPKERHVTAKTSKLCLNCLRAGHGANNCPSTWTCRSCGAKHHTLLHFERSSSPTPTNAGASSESEAEKSSPPQDKEPLVTMTSVVKSNSTVLLSTVQAEALDIHGNPFPVRILLDSASQLNFISENCMQRGGFARTKRRTVVLAINDTEAAATRGVTSIVIRAQGRSDTRIPIEATILPRISAQLPSSQVEPRAWRHLEGLRLADPQYHRPGPIDILIGADIFASLIRDGRRLGRKGEPNAFNSIFGWVLVGSVSTQAPRSTHSFLTLESLDASLSRFWQLEEIPTTSPYSQEDKCCEELFARTTRRNTDGRFIVSYPFTEDKPCFVGTRQIAVNRFRALERRFKRDTEFKTNYNKFMQDYLDNGYMRLIEQPLPVDRPVFYLPHHGVFKLDSPTIQVALAWIRSAPQRWETFVRNRVARIQFNTDISCWKHVDTKSNPADCCSRGLFPQELVDHPIWWTGPAWLIEFKPTSEAISDVIELPEEEERSCALVSMDLADVANSSTIVDSLLNRFSSLDRLIRVFAYCLRFINRTKSHSLHRTLVIDQIEFHSTLLYLVRFVQAHCFSEDIDKLKRNQNCSKPLRKLAPFLDARGVLRVGGRLTHSAISYEAKHPGLLPGKHRLTELIIERTHRLHLHPGRRALHYILSQNFWILGAHQAIKRCLSRCYRCFRANPRTAQPPMAALPLDRVRQAKPFSIVGVDYAGPFPVYNRRSRGATPFRAYVCLFVCFATKAVHLELAFSLSTDSFLSALRRFIARRGRCSLIYSDCGTNFVGAQRELATCMQAASEREQIRWSFNPPSAPHFGGLWEAGVKSMKTHLKRVIGAQILTVEEFGTLITQIEAVLNSRPLCPTSSDPNDLGVLSPGHFLTLEPLVAVPYPDLEPVPIGRLDRWQLVQHMHQQFWKRWHDEYLHTLQQRPKWLKSPTDIVQKDTLVLLKNENVPPLQWKRGRIIELHPGRDGISRVATVRTADGSLTRPLVKLCPLPMGGSTDGQERA